MGAGCFASAPEGEQGTKESAGGASPFLRVPVEKPPFTLSQIKGSVPPHCFHRSLALSFYYLAVDLGIIALLVYLAVVYIPTLPFFLRLVAWPLYWAAHGSVMMGIFIIVHECGHNAFSNYRLVDDLVGFILHSALLSPYFSFKYSHSRHHSKTNCVERDTVFVPRIKTEVQWFVRHLNNPASRFVFISTLLTIGWPCYMCFSYLGRKYDRFASHFDPNSPIFRDRERALILLSDAGVLVAGYGFYRLAAAFGFWWLVRVYGVPLLFHNAFIIVFGYLNHIHPAIPHYQPSEWDWLRGALSTVDRSFGILNRVMHNAAETHLIHHLFPTLPHYHAVEATTAIKPLLGDYYLFDNTPILKALWREVTECLYVEADDDDKATNSGILWFRNKY